jgi:antitoxin Phd
MPPSSRGKSRLLRVARVWRLLPQPQLERIELGPLRIGQHPQTGQSTTQPRESMTVWPVQDAQARFSALLESAQREGPQVVTRRGREAAVLVPIEPWHRLQASSRPRLKQLLLAPEARTERLVPPRGQARRRTVPPL